MSGRRLRGLSSARRCRTLGCELAADGDRGFCLPCDAVHRAAVELREQLLARRGARLRARHPELFGALVPGLRDRLLAHMAAQSPVIDLGLNEMTGLEDFLSELHELGLAASTRGQA